MMPIRRADNNQKAIVDGLRKYPDISVRQTHVVSNGFPDIAVGYQGETFLIELKDPKKYPKGYDSTNLLTPDEHKFVNTWNGHSAIAFTVVDVLRIINYQV